MLQVALPRCGQHGLASTLAEAGRPQAMHHHLQGVGEASRYCTSLAAGFIADAEVVFFDDDDAGASRAVCDDRISSASELHGAVVYRCSLPLNCVVSCYKPDISTAWNSYKCKSSPSHARRAELTLNTCDHLQVYIQCIKHNPMH
jgi:hypothetical protein